ncbi:MAG: hypothetical protein SFV15_18020 [Polyangiaceae bacterium]|nr:hypothetical protein [Polyangiaceae bacterium]
MTSISARREPSPPGYGVLASQRPQLSLRRREEGGVCFDPDSSHDKYLCSP